MFEIVEKAAYIVLYIFCRRCVGCKLQIFIIGNYAGNRIVLNGCSVGYLYPFANISTFKTGIFVMMKFIIPGLPYFTFYRFDVAAAFDGFSFYIILHNAPYFTIKLERHAECFIAEAVINSPAP